MNAVVLAYHNMGITGLEALVRHGFEILTIFTHEDDPSENCWFESVKTWAQRRNISVSTTENIHSEEWVEKIRSFHPDILFSFYYRKMIGKNLLEIPRLGAMNLHGSLLPAYRGRCPVNWVIINGEPKTGVTLHYMVEKPDAGDIVGQREVIIDPEDTAQGLYGKLCQAAALLLDDLLPFIKKERIPRIKQDLSKGSYYGGRRPEDGRIDWTKGARDIFNLIRAVTDPYPGAFGLLPDGLPIKILWAKPVDLLSDRSPGDIFLFNQEVFVQTGQGAIKLCEIEIHGKRLQGQVIYDLFQSGEVTKLI